MEHRDPERSISIMFFVRILKKYWILLLALALTVATVFGLVYSLVIYKPMYSSQSKFYVSNVSDDTYLYSSVQTAGASDMVKNCEGFLRGSVVLDAVLDEVGAEKTAQNRALLNSMIEIDVNLDRAIFAVRVVGVDAEQNLKIAQAIEKVLPKHVDTFNNQSKTENGSTDNAGQSTEKNGSHMLKITDRGVLDEVPDNSGNLVKVPLVAGLLTLLLVYMGFVFFALGDMTIYGKADLYEKLPSDISLFGVIPHWRVKKNFNAKKEKQGTSKKGRVLRGNAEERLIGRNKTPFEITEAFRMLCANVTFCSTGEKGCTVGVVSSLAASGKSFVMANLAVTMSRMIDKKVLLVDADMRVPMQHRIFTLKNEQGLSNLLAGQCTDVNEVIQHVNGLDILTSGTLPPNPVELLAGPKMESLLEQWKQEYDYILIDFPPVGEVADALAVSKLISGYMFVLRAGISDARLVRENCALLKARDVKIYGYVLTDVMEEDIRRDYYTKYARYSDYCLNESKKQTLPADPPASNS